MATTGAAEPRWRVDSLPISFRFMPILSNADTTACDGYSNAKATKRIVEVKIQRSDRMAKSWTAV
ncbi:MAG: hypothetical protein AAFX92_11360 [Pseudomonadota bacterium]